VTMPPRAEMAPNSKPKTSAPMACQSNPTAVMPQTRAW
jgi:hypothetical protein